MKRITIKAVLATLFATVLMAGGAQAALADDGSVTFNDGNVIAFAPGSALSETSLFDNFAGVMPGDVLEQAVNVKNENTQFDYLKVYLRAVPHDESNAPVSGVTAAASNEFLAQLSMKVWNGTDLIYEDSPDQPGGLATSTYLGQIASGEALALRVELTVPITLGNEFAGRIGEVDWEFTFEGFDVDVLTVRKVWTGDTSDLPESIDVQLLRDGDVFDTQALSEANQWTFTWADLDQDYTWDVQEVEVEGYTTTYLREGNDILITNDKPGVPEVEDFDLTVVKRWGESDEAHPSSVTMTLYNGAVVVDRVTLSDENEWTYTWQALDGAGAWRVIETNIDGAWVPSYSTSNYVVTVTNTHKLIETGQVSWPVPVFGGLGVVLLGLGLFFLMKRRVRES